jgi:hypothetical protein
MSDLPWTTGDDPATRNGARGRRKCVPHQWPKPAGSCPCLNEACPAGPEEHEHCLHCNAVKHPAVIRRNHNNDKRGGWFERWLTKRVPSWRGVGHSAVNIRKTECFRGHPFTPENTIIRGKGERLCRTCDRLWQRANRWRYPAERYPRKSGAAG